MNNLQTPTHPESRRGTLDYIEGKQRELNRFHYEHKIYLKDTNAFQNVYFAHYFDFMGAAREEFLNHILGAQTADFMKSGISLITVDSSIKYRNSLYLYDEFKVEVTVPKISKFKIKLDFEFVNSKTGIIHANSSMTIAAGMNGSAIPIPPVMVEAIKPFVKYD